SNVNSGSPYYYEVSATNRFGESTNSGPVTSLACALPAVPTNLVTSVSNSQVSLRWNTASGASTYTIGRFTGTTPITNVASGIATTNYTDTNAIAGNTYFYIVAASNSCNQSAFSAYAPAIMPPAAPLGLTASPGNTQVILNWSASSGASGYNVK